jgi:multimeric flavodoxin WrbA
LKKALPLSESSMQAIPGKRMWRMARILGISGSPNAEGNTAYSVRYAIGLVKDRHETEYISLGGLDIHPCVGCWSCSKTGRCRYKDGMETVYAALRRCDAVVIGSPVYMGMVSGQLKSMMDRCVLLRPGYDRPMELEGKVGCGIACGWFRNGGQETTLQNIHTFLLQQSMQVVNDGGPYSHAGATIVGEAEKDALGKETIEGQMRNLERALRGGSPV